MAIEYAIPANSYIKYDGTNAQEVWEVIQERMSSEVSIQSQNAQGMTLTFEGGAGQVIIEVPANSRLGVNTLEIVSPADWATKYVRP